MKAAKRATAAKEDAEPVLRLTKLMGLIGDKLFGSSLDVFILAFHWQQAGARDSAQVQDVSLPVASPPPPASESGLAMPASASAPADILVTVVETTQLAKSHKKGIPMCPKNALFTSFFVAATPRAAPTEPLSQSPSLPSVQVRYARLDSLHRTWSV